MNISTSPIMSKAFWPLIKLCEWMGRNMPEILIKIRFYAKFKRFPRLKDPQDLNEKILWQKLYADTSLWTELADKYRVRNYLESKGLGKYLVKLYGKWDNVDDIDFSTLPNEVIFKANNGDGKGTNLIIRDLRNADLPKIKAKLKGWLERKNIGDLAAEPQYKGIPPLIIAEQVIPLSTGYSSLVDYKIWCINGEPLFVYTCNDRDADGGGADVMTYDLEWNAHPELAIFTSEYRKAKLLPKPKNLDEMLQLAKTLSAVSPIVRVDLYNVDGKIYFGELTFTSQGGMMDYFTPEFLEALGQKADISKIKKIK